MLIATNTNLFNENFEGYAVGDKPMTGAVSDGSTWDAYATPNEKGWLGAYNAANGIEAFTVAEEDGNKYLTTGSCHTFNKVTTVKPNTTYTLSIRVRAQVDKLVDIGLYDATIVLKYDDEGNAMYPVMYKSGTSNDFGENNYEGLGLGVYYAKGAYTFLKANTWKDLIIEFTTGADTTTVLFQYTCVTGGGAVIDFDDFEIKKTNFVLDENFESFNVDDNPVADSVQSGANVSTPGANWQSYPNREGWYSGPVTGLGSDVDISVLTAADGDNTDNKALYSVPWKTFGKVVTVQPNTEYVLRFKNKVNSTASFQYNVLDVTGSQYVPFMNGGSLDTSVWTYLVSTKTSTVTTDTWSIVEAAFTTGENTTKVAINFISDNRTGYLDDVVVTKK